MPAYPRDCQSYIRMAEAVKVIVRCRPPNSKERAAKRVTIVSIDSDTNAVQIVSSEDAKKPKRFTFDAVFGEDSTQEVREGVRRSERAREGNQSERARERGRSEQEGNG